MPQDVPWQRDFFAARDPYTARVVLGLSAAATGGPFQPQDADLTSIAAYGGTGTWLYRSAADTWSPVTFGSNISFSGGVLNATGFGTGNVSNSGTPAAGEIAEWVTATTIKGTAKASLTGLPYLPSAGGNLSGSVAMVASSPAFTFYPTAGTAAAIGSANPSTGMSRWGLFLNDGLAESGGNSGSNFQIIRYSDAGASLGIP